MSDGIVIAGGGAAGLAAAIALGERGLPVMVIDSDGGATSARAEMVPEGAAAIFDRLGLSDVLAGACRIERVVSRWGAARMQAHGSGPDLGLHGWGLDRQALAQAMRQRLRDLRVPVLTGRLTTPRRDGDHWRLEIAPQRRISARYLIDATGRPARLARRNGASLLQGPDRVAVVWPTARSDARMRAEAAPDGWWYAVPHARGGSLGFVTCAATAKAVARAPAASLARAARGLTLVSTAGTSGPPRLMDARPARLDRMCGDGWLAAGDAAAAFDPLASQGLFNALSGGFFAGQAAADALEGDPEAPLVYQALAARTAERTFRAAHLQYAALPFDTPFWRLRAGLGPKAPPRRKWPMMPLTSRPVEQC